MVDKKLSEFSQITPDEISKLICLYLDQNNAIKNGVVDFATLNNLLMHKDGTETISGDKTFSGDAVFSGDATFNNTINGNISGKAPKDGDGNTISSTYAKLASANTFSGQNTFTEKNTFSDEVIFTTNRNAIRFVDSGYGKIFHQNSSAFYLLLTDQNDEYGNFNSLRPFTVNATNGVVTTTPNDTTHGVVTTEAIKKASKGYVKLGNGIIIQWGIAAISEYGSVTVTLPTAFTSTNYSVCANYKVLHTAADSEGCMTVDNFKTTTFRLSCGAINPNSGNTNWIAIGY